MENYFNYFTEIEECFQRARGTPSLLSTLDWALIESWKDAGIPLEAVLTGIERSFEKFRKRPNRFRKVNSLAYCSQEIMRAAEDASAGRLAGAGERTREEPPAFSKDEVVSFLRQNAEAFERASELWTAQGQIVLAQDVSEVAAALRGISESEETGANLEELERRMTALEEKTTASLTRASSVELLAEFRREIDHALAPYRRELAGPEIESLERQFIKRRLFEHYQIPRLSVFYM